MKKFIQIIILIIPTILTAQNYQLVWSDEFDGTEINRSNWINETGEDWYNNEIQAYTNSRSNSFVSDGLLHIVAKKEKWGKRNYTSARMKTQGLQEFKYGRLEARIKLPFGQGIWPAFWMLGSNVDQVSWPKAGEIDIMEMIGGQGRENTIYGTAHWDSDGLASYGGSKKLSSGNYSDDFHIYSITWDEKRIVWYVDNIAYHVISITPEALSEFHQKFFFILNVAVGGDWPGYPDATTQFPQTMEVDYLRVYQIVTDIETESTLPSELKLEQNYPNPFNPTTKIKFSVPENNSSQLLPVNLVVYNLLGKEVALLVNEYKTAGNYEVSFNAKNLPSGVYFYKLSMGANVITKKMMLLK